MFFSSNAKIKDSNIKIVLSEKKYSEINYKQAKYNIFLSCKNSNQFFIHPLLMNSWVLKNYKEITKLVHVDSNMDYYDINRCTTWTR